MRHRIDDDPHRDKPRTVDRRSVEVRLNAMASALSIAFEALSEVRHSLGVADRLEVQRRYEDPDV
jgi:hypothetical protein